MTQTTIPKPSRLRLAGTAAVAGGVGWLAVGLASTTVDLGDPVMFGSIEAGWIVVHLLLLAGLLGLASSGAAAGRPFQIGIGGAILGRLVFLAAEVPALLRGSDEGALLALGALLSALGMLLAGIAVVRAGRWDGWRRLVPLAIGAYPFVAMFPFVVIAPEPNPVAIAGWGVLWALLGIALRTATGAQRSHPA